MFSQSKEWIKVRPYFFHSAFDLYITMQQHSTAQGNERTTPHKKKQNYTIDLQKVVISKVKLDDTGTVITLFQKPGY